MTSFGDLSALSNLLKESDQSVPSTSFGDLSALSNLLKESDQSVPSSHNPSHGQALTPASFGHPAPAITGVNAVGVKKKADAKKDSNEIWDSDELVTLDKDFEDDGRIKPEYEIMVAQNVFSEDVFFGTSKTGSSIHCDKIIVKVKLPGCQMSELDLDVKGAQRKFLVQHPKFKLCTYLPKPVDDTQGNAKWDSKKEELCVTLPVALDEEEKMMRGQF